MLESVVVKVQQHKSGSINYGEKEVIAGLRSDTKCKVKILPTGLSLVQISMHCFREKQNTASNYVDSQFIIPSSTICKRHFSAAKRAKTYSFRALAPYCYDCLTFLPSNWSLQGVSGVNRIIEWQFIFRDSWSSCDLTPNVIEEVVNGFRICPKFIFERLRSKLFLCTP